MHFKALFGLWIKKIHEAFINLRKKELKWFIKRCIIIFEKKKWPALLIRISNLVNFVVMIEANLRTESKSAKSSRSTWTFLLFASSLIWFAAASAKSTSIQARTILAPRLPKSNAVSKPIPLLDPVIMATLPSKRFWILQWTPAK